MFCVSLLLATIARAGPTTEPALWAEMQSLAAKVEKVDSISADFEQRKFTPMLKKPLISSGTVLGKGSTALWKTTKPQSTSMLVSPKEIRIYYPQQAIVESYPVQGQLGALAASPLPRLDVLKQFFSFEKDTAASIDATKTDADFLAIRMTPSNAELQKHVKMVRVLLDRKTGSIALAENTDADGDRTLLAFSNVKLDADVSDGAMKLEIAAGTKETHPLEGMDGPP